MAVPIESNLDSVVDEPFAFQPRSDTRLHQQIHGVLVQHAGTYVLLNVF